MNLSETTYRNTGGKSWFRRTKKTVLSVSSGLDCNLSLDNKATPTTTLLPLLLSLAAKIFFSFFRFSLHFIFAVYQSTFSDYVKINTSNNKQQEWNVPEEKGVVMEVRSAIRWLPLCGPESDWRCAQEKNVYQPSTKRRGFPLSTLLFLPDSWFFPGVPQHWEWRCEANFPFNRENVAAIHSMTFTPFTWSDIFAEK